MYRDGDTNMKTKRRLSRYALARRLQCLALQIAAGKSIQIGSSSVRIPANAVMEEEIETTRSGTEIEFEIYWPASTAKSASIESAKRTRRARNTKE